MAISSFWPSAVAPIKTRMHCRSSSRRMLKCTPSAHTYTYFVPSKDRFVHFWNSSSQTPLSRVIVVADRPAAEGPTSADNASLKSPVLTPLRYSQGINSSRLFVLRKYGGRILEEKDSASFLGRRSSTRGCATSIGPTP